MRWLNRVAGVMTFFGACGAAAMIVSLIFDRDVSAWVAGVWAFTALVVSLTNFNLHSTIGSQQKTIEAQEKTIEILSTMRKGGWF